MKKVKNFRINTSLLPVLGTTFLARGFTAGIIAYQNALFLSNYPKKLLPLFYIFETIFASITLLIHRYLFKRVRHLASIQQLLFIIVFMIFTQKFYQYWSVFIYCLLLSMMFLLTVNSSWRSITKTFNIRQLKVTGRWINLSGTFGAMVVGFSIPILIRKLSLSFLPYFMMINSFLLLLLFLFIQPREDLLEETILPKKETLYYGYRLLFAMLAFAIYFYMTYTLADYILKSQLIKTQSGAAIGIFIGNLIGICSIISIIIDLTILNTFIRSYGIVSLLVAIPIFLIFSGVLLLVTINLYSAAILCGGMIILVRYLLLENQLFLNILPDKILSSLFYHFNILIRPLGTLTGAIIIYLTAKFAQINILSIIIVMLSFLSLVLIAKIKASYFATLKNMVRLKRYLFIADEYDKTFALQNNRNKLVAYQLKSDNIYDVQAAIRALTCIPKKSVEKYLWQLFDNHNPLILNTLAKYLAIRACQIPLSKQLKTKIYHFVQQENLQIQLLRYLLKQPHSNHVFLEVQNRINFIIQRILYWLAALTQPQEILESIPRIVTDSKTQMQARAIELLEIYVADKNLSKVITQIFDFSSSHLSESQFNQSCHLIDPWILKVLKITQDSKQLKRDKDLELIFFLRQVKIIANLPAELLQEIANHLTRIQTYQDQTIFEQGQTSDKFYFIFSGEITAKKDKEIVKIFEKYDSFGELGLLDNSPRSTSCMVTQPGLLLAIEKNYFAELTHRYPEILKSIVQVIMTYLRGYAKDNKDIGG